MKFGATLRCSVTKIQLAVINSMAKDGRSKSDVVHDLLEVGITRELGDGKVRVTVRGR